MGYCFIVGMCLALALAGCNPYADAIQFHQVPNGFEYRTIGDWTTRPDDAQAEASRRAEIAKHVSRNGLCPKGYELERFVAEDPNALGVTVYRIDYHGRCKL